MLLSRDVPIPLTAVQTQAPTFALHNLGLDGKAFGGEVTAMYIIKANYGPTENLIMKMLSLHTKKCAVPFNYYTNLTRSSKGVSLHG